VGQYVRELEAELGRNDWLAGPTFSLADILTFANLYALPAGYPEFATERHAPRLLDWLRRIYARPATARTFALARSLGRRAFGVADLLGVPMPQAAHA
jgi:glutathione S-transferase/GST-like protein